ncbi:MAG: hypothetical protein ChlgKO_01530 [Chlamydiales bacterium]
MLDCSVMGTVFSSQRNGLPPGLVNPDMSASIGDVSQQSTPKKEPRPVVKDTLATPEKTHRRAWFISIGIVAAGAGAVLAYKASRSGGKGWIAASATFLLVGISTFFSGWKKD